MHIYIYMCVCVCAVYVCVRAGVYVLFCSAADWGL